MNDTQIQPNWTSPECVVCLVTISYDLLQRCTNDPKIQMEGMKQIYRLLRNFNLEDIPTKIAMQIYRMILNLTNETDPFIDVKKKSNELAKAVIRDIREHISMAKTPISRFRRALAAAIAGNVIDFGTAGHSIEMNSEYFKEVYLQIVHEGFAIDHSTQLLDALSHAKRVVYIADNAGEVYFDLFLLEQLKQLGVEVIYVVKGGPVINDATMEDVTDPLFREAVSEIITTGTNALGVFKAESSDQFLNHLQKADLIIAKGQSNFETLYYDHKEITTGLICFIFRTKCVSIAQFLGQSIRKNIIMLKAV